MNNIEKAILNLISEKLLLACEVRDYFCSEMVIFSMMYLICMIFLFLALSASQVPQTSSHMFPDASHMRPRCFPHASQMLPKHLPEIIHDCSFMILLSGFLFHYYQRWTKSVRGLKPGLYRDRSSVLSTYLFYPDTQLYLHYILTYSGTVVALMASSLFL